MLTITYRVRVFGRGAYSWGEAIEAISVRVRRGSLADGARRKALREGLRRARARFAFADSFEAEVIS